MATSPFRIELYSDVYGDRIAGVPTTGAKLGPIGNPISVNATFRRNGLGSVQVIVSPLDPINDLLMADGTYADVFYRGRREMTGKIRTRQGSFTKTGTRTYWIRDDRAVLDDVLAWVHPTRGNASAEIGPESLGDDGQWWGTVPLQGTGDLTGAVGYYDWTEAGTSTAAGTWPGPFTGLPATTEDAIRKLYYLNMRRFNTTTMFGGSVKDSSGHRGLPISSVADLPQVRFGKLSDYINPMADAAGLIVRVLRDHYEHTLDEPDISDVRNGPFYLEITEPREWGAALTAESGVIVEPSTWVLTDPTVTRAVLGGQGDLAARVLKQYPSRIDLNANPAHPWTSDDEDRIQWISEIFRDATGTAPTWPTGVPDLLKVAAYYEFRPEPLPADVATFLNALDAAGVDALAAGVATSGLSITLAETAGFHYGGDDGIWLGDIVTVRDPSGLEFTDSLSEVAIVYDDSGTKVTPKVGNRQDDPTRQIYDRIAALAAAQRKLSTSK